MSLGWRCASGGAARTGRGASAGARHSVIRPEPNSHIGVVWLVAQPVTQGVFSVYHSQTFFFFTPLSPHRCTPTFFLFFYNLTLEVAALALNQLISISSMCCFKSAFQPFAQPHWEDYNTHPAVLDRNKAHVLGYNNTSEVVTFH